MPGFKRSPSDAVVKLLRGWRRTAVLAALGLASAAPALAQDAADGADLAAKATDPTAALMSFQLNDWYTASFHGVDDASLNQIVLRAAIPFRLGDSQHIFRITQPYVSSSPSGDTGFADITVFDLMTFDRSWGRFGVGLTASLPTGASKLTGDKWTAGPALGFVNSSVKKINWGLFMQSFFSFAGDDNAAKVGLANFQPIASYQLGKGRSLSLGNSALIYDFEQSRWASLQMGLNYGAVVGFWGHKWRPNFEVDYDFQNDTGTPGWTVRAGMTLLLPVN